MHVVLVTAVALVVLDVVVFALVVLDVVAVHLPPDVPGVVAVVASVHFV